jgi:hypothetical protein
VDLHEELEDAKETLKQAACEHRGAYEFRLFFDRQGVVYVPETAPVLVRKEYGVVAAEASESGCFTRTAPIMHCCAEPPFLTRTAPIMHCCAEPPLQTE